MLVKLKLDLQFLFNNTTFRIMARGKIGTYIPLQNLYIQHTKIAMDLGPTFYAIYARAAVLSTTLRTMEADFSGW